MLMEKLKSFISWKDLFDLEALCDSIEAESTDESEMRTKFEEVTICCGSDICLGGTIYKKYIEFEIEELADLIETGGEEASVKKQKERVISLIHRQMSLPLIGNENALQDISEYLSQYFSENDEKLINPTQLQMKYQKGLEKRAARMIYEDRLFADDDDNSSQPTDRDEASKIKVHSDIWKTYIKFEMNDKEYSRVQRLYDRALNHIPNELSFWCEYIDFALFTIKSWTVLLAVTERALKMEVFLASAYIWQLHLLALEVTKQPQEKVFESVNKAMSVTFPTADDYLDLQSFKSDYLLRQLKEYPENDTRIEGTVTALRGCVTELEGLLLTYYPDWAAGWLRYCKYATKIEETILHKEQPYYKQHIEAMRSSSKDFTHCKVVWEAATTKFGTYQYIWNEYISWAKSNHQYDLCRKLFKRAVQLVQDYKSTVAKDWLLFEREQGSITDLITALQNTKTTLDPWGMYLHSQSATNPVVESSRTTATITSSTPAARGKESKRNSDLTTGDSSVNGRPKKPRTDAAVATSGDSDSTHHRTIRFADEVQSNITPESEIDANNVTNHLNTTDSFVYQQFNPIVREPIVDIYANKIFVKNLPFTVSSDDLRSHVTSLLDSMKAESSQSMDASEEQEPVFTVELILSKAGKSRGMAIIDCGETINSSTLITVSNGSIFSSRSLSACALDKHVLEENSILLKSQTKPIDPSASDAGTSTAVVAQSISAHHPTTIFVSKFPKEWTTDDLRNVFDGCGNIVEVKIPVDKKTGQIKGHALVQFEAEESKTAALLKNRNSIKGHIISVQPSKFPAVVPVIARSANEQTSKGGGSSSGAGKSERTGFYHSLSSAEKTHESRFNPYLSTSGSGHSDSSTGQKRTKLSLESVSESSASREGCDQFGVRASSSAGKSSTFAFKPRSIKK